MIVQHSCPYYKCECILPKKGKQVCVSKALHECNHPRSLLVSLTKEEKTTYLFVFNDIERRMKLLKQEQDYIKGRFESWENGVNQVYADLNSMKAELMKKMNKKNKLETERAS